MKKNSYSHEASKSIVIINRVYSSGLCLVIDKNGKSFNAMIGDLKRI